MSRIHSFLIIFFSAQGFANSCPYPAESINWVMRYCAFKAATDDEVVIQNSPCFKSAAKDLEQKDSCNIKEKYKSMFCTERIKIDKKYKSVQDCLRDTSVLPFFAG